MRNPVPTEERTVRETEPVAQDYGTVREPVAGRRAPLGAPQGRPAFAGTVRRWQDWANLLLGAWYFVAAWVLTDTVGTASNNTVIWNNWIAGGIVFLAALWALARPSEALPEWVNVAAGIWIFISPWVLSFSTHPGVNWDAWIVGILVFIFAVWALSIMGSGFGRRRAAL